MKILNTKLIKECKEKDLTEGLIDKIKAILKGKKSDAQAIQDISDIINVDLGPSDKPEKQGQKIKVDEALHGRFDIETFFKMAKDIGLETLGDLEKFLKNEKRPEDKDEWETMLRYRASLGNDFKIKEELTEDKETCILCGKHIEGYGNNPAPLADEGKCCDECNKTKVIPARMKTLRGKKMNEAAEDNNKIYIVVKEFEDSDFGFSKIGDEYDLDFQGEDINDEDSYWDLDPYDEYLHGEPEALKTFTNKDKAIFYINSLLSKTSKEDRLAIYETDKNPNKDGLYETTVIYIVPGTSDEPSDRLVQFYYYVYELDEEDGSELDEVEAFENEEEAKKFADSLDFPAHVVFVPSPDSDTGPEYSEYIDNNSNYYDYEIIYRNKAAEELNLEECLHKHCHKEFKFDDSPYAGRFHGAEIETEKEIKYDDEPSMNY